MKKNWERGLKFFQNRSLLVLHVWLSFNATSYYSCLLFISNIVEVTLVTIIDLAKKFVKTKAFNKICNMKNTFRMSCCDLKVTAFLWLLLVALHTCSILEIYSCQLFLKIFRLQNVSISKNSVIFAIKCDTDSK